MKKNGWKIESLQLQLQFEEILDDDKELIARLKSDILDRKLRILFDEEIEEDDEKEYF